MTCATWSARLALVVLGCSVAATLAPVPAGADTRLVDCASGRRLATALRLPTGRQLTVIVRGTCNESVTIARDDVTLRGESPAAGSGVNGTIVIDGARRVLVENLTISGPGIGIQGIHGAAFMVRSSVIQDTVGAGIVLQGARATIDANTLQRTGGAGVNLDTAEAIITGNTIDAIRGAGIQVTNASAAKIGLTEAGTPAGNAIQNDTGNGVMITNGSVALLRSNTVELNAGAGVFTVRSLVTLQGGNLIQSPTAGTGSSWARASSRGARARSGTPSAETEPGPAVAAGSRSTSADWPACGRWTSPTTPTVTALVCSPRAWTSSGPPSRGTAEETESRRSTARESTSWTRRLRATAGTASGST